MLHGSEMWAVSTEDLKENLVCFTGCAMSEWIYESVRMLRETGYKNEMCKRDDWYGDLMHMDKNNCVKKCWQEPVEESDPGRHGMRC